jgi:hypothetical protein
VNVADDQKQHCSGEADDPKKPLQASATQHGYYGKGCGQAEHRHRIASTNRLHDLAPELTGERPTQGDDRPSQGAPHLLGSKADDGQATRLNMAPATPPSWTISEVSSRHTWPRAMRVQLRSKLFKSQGATVNWARVGIPTMIMATVVAHGQRARGGVASERTREAANAVVSTIAYSVDSRAVVTLSILRMTAYAVIAGRHAAEQPAGEVGSDDCTSLVASEEAALSLHATLGEDVFVGISWKQANGSRGVGRGHLSL